MARGLAAAGDALEKGEVAFVRLMEKTTSVSSPRLLA